MEVVSNINFVPCMKWVKRGIAEANPDKVQLSQEELEDIIKQTRDDLSDAGEDLEEEDGNVVEENGADPMNKYNLDDYDNEKEKINSMLALGNLTVYASNTDDPYVELDEDSETEKEDDVINASDNLMVVGHVEGDASILEVYVFNEEEGSLYVHHDFLLPSLPLCLEWLNHDTTDKSPGNLIAVGSMDTVIDIWDLDVMDCLEPATRLGKKGSRRKGIKHVGHRDAVLDLSWNSNFTHILASGSADQTVMLWDLDMSRMAKTLTGFEEKVQTLQWHPFEAQTLLAGSCDGSVRVFDCRVDDAVKTWEVAGEVERVIWNHYNPFCFLASTSTGAVHLVDCRTDQPVWQLSAHEKEVTGLALSSQCPGMLVTAGGEGLLKVWDISGEQPEFVFEKALGMGQIQCMESCPDAPFAFCIGGDNRSHNVKVWSAMDATAVQNRFSSRALVLPVRMEEPQLSAETEMDTTAEGASTALETLTLEVKPAIKTVTNFTSGNSKKKKKLKNKT